jgi:hypothetical protein
MEIDYEKLKQMINKHSKSLLKSFIRDQFVPVQKVDFSLKSAHVLRPSVFT